ncbi:MAG: methyltransferase domain-containing protein [bacterium]|nr:methyltransferase domain-containing protein [bacterium]
MNNQLSPHTQWQSDHYDNSPPLNPFESINRKMGFSKILRPKDLRTFQYLKSINLNSESKILDIGCAHGLLLQRINKTFNTRGVGVDISNNLINKARKEDTINDYVLTDATKLPFPDNSFDLVLSFDNLEHIQEYQKVMQEIVRVLKPEGKLLLNTINKNNKYTFDWLFEKFGSDYHLKRAGHVKELFFDPAAIKKVFEQFGLKNTKVELFDAPFILITDCVLYIFLMILEKIGRFTNAYKTLGHFGLAITTLISYLLLPILQKADTVFTNRGYSNAFFITGEKI